VEEWKGEEKTKWSLVIFVQQVGWALPTINIDKIQIAGTTHPATPIGNFGEYCGIIIYKTSLKKEAGL